MHQHGVGWWRRAGTWGPSRHGQHLDKGQPPGAGVGGRPRRGVVAVKRGELHWASIDERSLLRSWARFLTEGKEFKSGKRGS